MNQQPTQIKAQKHYSSNQKTKNEKKNTNQYSNLSSKTGTTKDQNKKPS